MIPIIIFLLVLSLVTNAILVWYTRKIIKNLDYGVRNVDEFQQMLNEYAASLIGMSQLDQYYGDDTIAIAVKNTNIVIDACKTYKKTILELGDEVDIEDGEKG